MLQIHSESFLLVLFCCQVIWSINIGPIQPINLSFWCISRWGYGGYGRYTSPRYLDSIQLMQTRPYLDP